jgi:hypothetical protein
VFGRLQSWLRSHRGYVRLRKAQRVGFRRYARWQRQERLVLRTPPARTRPADDPAARCAVHLLTWKGDWRLALWAAKSFYHFAGVDWPLVFHDGGGIDAAIRGQLLRHFPAAAVVGWDEATDRVEPVLLAAGHRHLAAARRANVMFRKLVDVAVLGRTAGVVCLDSDVLFFAPPAELVRLGDAGPDRVWVNRDAYDMYSATAAQVNDWFGLALPAGVNAGLNLQARDRIDLAFLDGLFAPGRVPFDRDVFPEQTAVALLGARHGLGYLPPEYEVAVGPAAAGEPGGRLVSRHYVSPVREWMYDEGLAYLIRETRILSPG